jgi:hypothetical protein
VADIAERLKRLLSQERAERGAEEDIIKAAPPRIRERLREFLARRRKAEKQKRAFKMGKKVIALS